MNQEFPEKEKILKEALSTIQANPSGISSQTLLNKLQQHKITNTSLAHTINTLLSSQQIELSHSTSGILYKPLNTELQVILTSLDENEKILFNLIRNSGNCGVWIKDLSRNSGLSRTIIPKILKSMEHKLLIKNIKSVKYPGRKMYMLYDIEPGVDVSGGAWFTDNELDSSFVGIISKAAVKYIYDKDGIVTAKNVCDFVNSKGVTSIELQEEDLVQLLEMLVYDRQLERSGDGYICDQRSSILLDLLSSDEGEGNDMSSWLEVPCLKCPVAKECSLELGPVTPKSCVYFKQWLEL